jgi:hypothetical protein
VSDRHGLFVLALVGALTAWPTVARGEGKVAPPPVCAHLRLVDADADARALLGELGDVLSADLPRLDVAMAPAQEVSRLFRSDDPDAACVTAWVVVEATRARIRVAGAGRCRYVFRELDLEQPLSALDRERLAQVTSAALSAVGDNAESTECAPPPVVVAPTAPIAPVPSVAGPVAATTPPSTVHGAPKSSAPFSSLAIGASYGGTYYLSAFRPGPGLSVVAAEPSWLYDPEIWVELRYVLASWSEDGEIQTVTGRVGVSARWWPLVRYGLGVGVDRVETTSGQSIVDSVNPPVLASTYRTWEPAARAFARIASPSWNALSLSLTVLVDVVHAPDPTNAVRGGLVVEGWWRS